MAKTTDLWEKHRAGWRLKALATKTKPLVESLFAPCLRRAKARWPFITANFITGFRTIMALILLMAAKEPFPVTIVVAVGYFLAALMDSLDGAWARANEENSKVGKIFDPFVDMVIVISWLLLFRSQGMFSWRLLSVVAIFEAISKLIYLWRLDRLEGANWFGGAKKATQDCAILLTILGFGGLANWTLWVAIGLSAGSSITKVRQPRVAAQEMRQQKKASL